VTTLIKKGLPSPALMYWSARTVAEWVADHPDLADQMSAAGGRGPFVAFLKEIPWQKRDTAAIRGTAVHELAERLSHGEAVEVPDHLTGYVNACVRFLDDWQMQPLLTERPCFSRKWGHAGTFDFIGTIRDGRTVIGDFKTARGVYPETCLQLAAYRHSESYMDADGAEQPMPAVDAALIVHIGEDDYTVHEARSDEDTYRAFLHVAHVARTADAMKKGGWLTEAATPEETTE
jgi:hypothetical protein